MDVEPIPAEDSTMMRGARIAMLDADSLGADIDFGALQRAADSFRSFPATSPAQLVGHAAGANVLVCNKTPIGDADFAALPHVELVLVTATGTNNIDLSAAALRGITVCNCRDYGTPAVAQHVMMLILALHTRVLDYDRKVRAGEWQRAEQFCLMDVPIVELAGRALGIFGFGALGQAVSRLAEAFGMQVLVAQLPGRPARTGTLPWREVLARADVVSLHCPLTDATRGLIDADALATMKPGAFLINTARGGLVDEVALADALRSGHLGGAGVDVLTSEPPRDGNPLLAADIPNLIVTPHNAWATLQARQRLVAQTAENLMAWRRGAPIRAMVSGE
ncbi:2-hydroxyacid dehydrogenase [Xanthomonadaceae bacterium JHOS43]|nr:2-hydroxyacid dehydrogenase [Xanthomonadaceae bacterium JHOS43]MCX7562166.1 2-hydroxyacid dehydrogenase [Xanthomonadaceae bacterium XH05]